MSCSQIETLAKCPYSYFLRYVLRLKPVEELTLDPSVWLDAKTKGELYHLIFERFYKGLQKTGVSLDMANHEKYLYDLAEALISGRYNLNDRIRRAPFGKEPSKV